MHAHPDDETINNGVTMAKYAAEGVQVTLVTCTRGEEGEVLVESLANLASSRDDKLGEHREIELKNAMEYLGIKDFRFLGSPNKKWRDTLQMIGQCTFYHWSNKCILAIRWSFVLYSIIFC